MVADLKPYPRYKESGEKWLGKVPAHWGLMPNRALFEEVKDRNHPTEEMLSVTITRGIIQQRALLSDSSKKDSSNINKGAYKLVQPGDIAYNKMRAWQGAVGASSFRGIVSPAYVVMRPRGGSMPWFYHHLYRTPLFAKEAERWSYGITSDMWSLRPEHFKVVYSVRPPADEQAAIVPFLDHANRKIDGSIRAKRKLIALLGEQKQAIVHRAVTRGLNPNAPLKPSGIPWLGDVPRHWEVWPLRRCISIRSGDFMDGARLKNERSDSSPIPVIGGNGNMGFADQSNVSGLTIVIGRVGALCGNVHLVKEAAWITDNALRITRIEGFDAGYLAEQLRAMNLNLLANANAQPLVTGGIIKAQRVVKPPQDEQRRIIDELERLFVPVTTAIARTEREIALMQEYRTRLTADVVTGKLDVRAAAADLPPTSEEARVETDVEELVEEDELVEAEA